LKVTYLKSGGLNPTRQNEHVKKLVKDNITVGRGKQIDTPKQGINNVMEKARLN